MTDNKRFTLKLGRFYKDDKILQNDDVLNLLNELNNENEQLKQELKTKVIVNKQYEELQKQKKENWQLKSIIINLFGNITELDWIREEYCNGVLGLFEKAESLDEARLMIKEYLE